LTRPAPAPARKRKRGDEEQGFIRKHLRRLWRKMARQAGEDWRDPPPSVDSQWWHWHRQSTADRDHRHDESRNCQPDYPSPTP
jgi:hypothetical protein